ncbi:MAG: DUF4271 domain-containing protein [Dysgonamonadaceae bacterium]|jgi:hypothetical protein|nr:DUF4271 domain-containing protein [Dysgonamonadaceae bacterium]
MILGTVELANKAISARPLLNNWGFVVFFLLFFVYVRIVGRRSKMLFSMGSELFHNKERQSIFYDSFGDESINKAVLCLQTVVLFVITLYCYAIEEHIFPLEFTGRSLAFAGYAAAIALVFVLYKLLAYNFIGCIFYSKTRVKVWNGNFISIIALSGLIIFFPVLAMFFVEGAYKICLYFLIFYAILASIFTFYKIYLLFFQGKGLLLHFILYLCTQELIPLYLLYRGIDYLFQIVQKDILWIHT